MRLQMLHWVRERVQRILEGLLILLLAASIVNVLYQVLTRFVLRQSSPYTEELARFFLIWIGLLGSSYAAGRKMHLAVDLFLAKLDGKKKATAELLIQTLILLFAAVVMVYAGLRLVLLTFRFGQISSALRLKMGCIYLALPLSGIFIALSSLTLMAENFIDLSQKRKAGSRKSSERQSC
ncbi:MAG: TRAP transporter small permease [Candidatus Aminicenantales bacterium]